MAVKQFVDILVKEEKIFLPLPVINICVFASKDERGQEAIYKLGVAFAKQLRGGGGGIEGVYQWLEKERSRRLQGQT